MRKFAAACMTLLAFSAAGAATYEWVDGAGVTHFTDNPEKVPEKYRKKVKERESIRGEEPPAAPAPPAPQPPPAESVTDERQGLRGGHDETWWRSGFAAIRDELDAIQKGLPAKREQLTNIHRKRVIYQKPSTRVAYNELKAEIERDEAQVKVLEERLRSLDADADRAGVPSHWRR